MTFNIQGTMKTELIKSEFRSWNAYQGSLGEVVCNDRPLDESDLLVRVQDGGGSFREPVRAAMTDRLETLQPSESLDAVRKILDSGKVTIVMDGAEFVGLITRIDLLNYLRRKV